MPLNKDLEPSFSARSGWFFGGCGSAVLTDAFPNLGIGFLGVAIQRFPWVSRLENGFPHPIFSHM
jgi:hypothetical protein